MKPEIRGVDDLIKNLAGASRGLTRPRVLGVLTRAAEPMRTRMGDLAVHGHTRHRVHLSQNIVVSPETKEAISEPAVAVGPSETVFYGRFVEYGSHKRSAQPFARPAFDATASATLARIGADLWDVITGGIK